MLIMQETMSMKETMNMMNDRILVPMAIRYRKVEDKMVYTGFIPGFDGNDVISDTLEECRTL